MKLCNKLALMVTCAFVLSSITACAPEVGTDAWCEKMSNKPKGDWTANEAGDYAKHCIFK
jgi:hypothetical protein